MGEWSASHSCRFNQGEMVPGIHWIEGWVDNRANIWTKWRSENSLSYRDSNPYLSVVQPVDSRYTECDPAGIEIYFHY
jgi:hypothetical protein